MIGLPASGKSTRAKEIIDKTGNTVRINKDLLRTMLHFDKFNYHNEDKTREAAKQLARYFLSKGTNVIIDDTNLNEGTVEGWKTLAIELNARVEYCDFTNVPVEECVMRDLGREKYVGGTVIKNMALLNGIQPKPSKGYVLCDIDGTIADITHRLHYVNEEMIKSKGFEKKDWKGFFSEISNDTVREDTRKILIDYYNKGYTVIFVSARPEDYKKETLEWLEKNYLSFAWTVIMRKSGDKRPDNEVKQEMYDRYFKDKYPIEVVIDDRPRIIRMWQENGLKVIDVGQGREF